MSTSRYCAFISYRHRDPDMAVAKRLHTMIENYTIPAGIRGKDGKKHPGRVFRDQEELPLTADLGRDIEIALEESDWLICVCSPRYLESAWCMRELEYFIGVHGRERVLTVLTEGEPEESFPRQLLYETLPTGEEKAQEPLAADVRAGSVPEMLKKLKKEKLRLLAPMLGTSFDGLFQRQKRRAARRALAAALAVILALGSFLAYALVQNRRIDAQRVTASRNETDLLVEKSTYYESIHRRDEARALALRARDVSGTIDGYGESAVREALAMTCYAGDFTVETVIDMDTPANIATTDVFSPDGSLIAAPTAVTMAATPSEMIIPYTLTCCDASTGQRLWQDQYDSEITSVHWREDSAALTVTAKWAHTVRVLDARTGETLHELYMPWAFNACWSGNEIYICFDRGIVRWDPDNDPDGQDMTLYGNDLTQFGDAQVFHGRYIMAHPGAFAPYLFRIVDMERGLMATYETPFEPMVTGYTLSPDGMKLFIRQFAKVYVCNLESEEILWQRDLDRGISPLSTAHQQDPVWYGGRIFDNITGMEAGDRRMDAYDALTGEALYTLEGENCLGVTSDGQYLICTGGLYRITDGTLLTELTGTLVAFDSQQDHYLVRETATLKETALGKGSQYTLDAYAGTLYKETNETRYMISPDDRYTVIINAAENAVILADLESEDNAQHRVRDFNLGSMPTAARVVFSPDSKLVALGGSNGNVAVYDLATGEEKGTWFNYYPNNALDGLSFSPDSAFLMAANYKLDSFGVYSAATGRMLYEMHAAKPVKDWGFDTATGDAAVVYEDGSALMARIFNTPEKLYDYAAELEKEK